MTASTAAALPRRSDTSEIAFDELCGSLAARELTGLWSRPNMPSSPVPRTQAHQWRWSTVAPLAERAGSVVRVDDRGDARRALQFCNPGLPMGTTESLFGAYQYLSPGETAPAHRHSPAAIRFVLTGHDTYTTVDGDACEMTPGDLVLTPNWAWHDHTNYGVEPIIWFDAIDVPLIASLDAVFFEDHPTGMQSLDGRGASETRFGAVGLRDSTLESETPYSPLLRYPYGAVSRTLDNLLAGGGPSASVDYENPLTGGPAVPTISCRMTRVLPGCATVATRQTGGQIHVVFRGRGTSIIGDTAFEWEQGDVFVVPSWTPVEHRTTEPSDLFVTSNRAVLEALHLFREETLADPLEVRACFTPT